MSPSSLAEPRVREAATAHRMCREVRKLSDLWREWTVGLRGQLVIATLDSRLGSQWRAGRQSELQLYSLRLEIIKEIRCMAQAQRISEGAVMHAVSFRQQQMLLDRPAVSVNSSTLTREPG